MTAFRVRPSGASQVHTFSVRRADMRHTIHDPQAEDRATEIEDYENRNRNVRFQARAAVGASLCKPLLGRKERAMKVRRGRTIISPLDTLHRVTSSDAISKHAGGNAETGVAFTEGAMTHHPDSVQIAMAAAQIIYDWLHRTGIRMSCGEKFLALDMARQMMSSSIRDTVRLTVSALVEANGAPTRIPSRPRSEQPQA